jgi:uncharacterized protein (TIGR02118 family)
MRIAIFVTIWTTQTSPADLRDYFLDRPLAFLRASTEVVSVDLFVPDTGNVALFDDGPAPALMIQIDMSDHSGVRALVESDEFRQLILAESAYGGAIDDLTLDVFETVHFAIPGQQEPPPRTAPLSFVVRYYGPTQDGTAFVRFYTENHPPILATFPGIRNVLCYLPLEWRTSGEVPDARVIIGNEVVFDDLDALNRALESDVLPRLKADGRRFAKFGYNTHHAMRRERVFTGSAKSNASTR